jgi:2-phospho-L-lactate guanylyltransferase
MWAVVPLKSPERAKSRLAAVLGTAQRRHLFFALAEQVIRALRATRRIETVAVVTSDAEVAAFARALGAQPIRQPGDFGTTCAFATAVHQLRSSNPAGLLMIPGDLPLVSSAALERLIEAADAVPGIVVVPDRRRQGTNALLCTPPDAIAPRFDGDSFAGHLAAAAAAGVAARVVEIEELALDLDVGEDLEYLQRHRGADAVRLLTAAGIGEAARALPRFAGASL